MKVQKIKYNPGKNQKGLATIETVVLLVVLISLFYYSFGFFGVVHTALLHNIHGRTYAFETFRHRTNLTYFRSNRATDTTHYYEKNARLHGINAISGAGEQVATERPITMGSISDEENRRTDIHNEQLPQRVVAGQRNESLGVNPVWLMVLYGICFNSECRRN